MGHKYFYLVFWMIAGIINLSLHTVSELDYFLVWSLLLIYIFEQTLEGPHD